jgi:transcriptional regulator with XRE-family HTH domain
MSKRKTMDKAQARERRNQLLESAASANLSLTEGVREMRAIAGMTQEEFAQHRGVSARVIKAIELGQGNPTVATLNRIGEFFGLEVAFVPVRRTPMAGKSEGLDTPTDAAPRIFISYSDQDHVIGTARRLLELLESLKVGEETGEKDISNPDPGAVAAHKKKKARPS